jgi:hypothetical protein
MERHHAALSQAPRETTQDACRIGDIEQHQPTDDRIKSLVRLAFRTFRSLAEVRQAHARCDPVHGAEPLPPPDEGRPDE